MSFPKRYRSVSKALKAYPYFRNALVGVVGVSGVELVKEIPLRDIWLTVNILAQADDPDAYFTIREIGALSRFMHLPTVVSGGQTRIRILPLRYAELPEELTDKHRQRANERIMY